MTLEQLSDLKGTKVYQANGHAWMVKVMNLAFGIWNFKGCERANFSCPSACPHAGNNFTLTHPTRQESTKQPLILSVLFVAFLSILTRRRRQDLKYELLVL